MQYKAFYNTTNTVRPALMLRKRLQLRQLRKDRRTKQFRFNLPYLPKAGLPLN
jgi:hypothetical protein